MTVGDLLGGRYRLEAELGEDSGVFRAVDTEADAPVAVKVFPAIASDDTFRREAAIAMRARHPNLVGLLDAGVTGDRGWLVCEYVAGLEVRDRLREYGPMGVRRSLDVAAQLFAALDALHRRGLSHGDIKPDNVLLDEGRVRVFDFGMGRVHRGRESGDGMYPGTPPYMHPALFRGEVASARTDCFAAWVTTYEILSGRLPYPVRVLRGAAPLPPPPPVGDVALDRLLAAGLDGALGDARAAWLALTRFLRGRFDLPRARPAAPALPPHVEHALLARVRAGESVGVVGPLEAGRVALEALHHDQVRAGGWVLWARADWGSATEPLSGALSLAVDAMDALGEDDLARVGAALGPLREPLAAAIPAVRAWLGAPVKKTRPPAEHLVFALTRLLEACPRPLLVLVDGLDRIDGASRRFLGSLVTGRALVVVGTAAPGFPHAMPTEVRLPDGEPAVASDDGLDPADAQIVAAARVLGLPFGPRLERIVGLTSDRLLDVALEAEAHGVARWDGAAVVPRPGPTPSAAFVERWCREAASRLDAAAEPLLVARYAMLGRDARRLAAVLDAAVAEAVRLEPTVALELLAHAPAPHTPAHRLRALQVAALARDVPAAHAGLAALERDPAAGPVDRAEAEGEIAFRSGATVSAIDAFGRAAAALGRPISTGLRGALEDIGVALRVRFNRPLPPRPDPRLARIFERLYDLHFCWDAGPLLRIHALWRQADPRGARARSMDVVFRTALGMEEAARATEAELRAELREEVDPVGAAVVLAHIGMARLWRGETVGAFADAMDASERLLRVGDPFLGALASSVVWVGGFHLANVPEMRRLRVALQALVEATGDRRAGAWLTGANGVVAWLAGDLDEAMVEARRWAEDAEQREDSSGIVARRYLGEMWLERGDLARALDELGRCEALARRYHVRFDWVEAAVIGLLVADARRRLAKSPGVPRRWWIALRAKQLARVSPRWRPRVTAALAWQAVAGGNTARAIALFDAAEADARGRQQHHDTWWVLQQRALALSDAEAAVRADEVAARHGIKGARARLTTWSPRHGAGAPELAEIA